MDDHFNRMFEPTESEEKLNSIGDTELRPSKIAKISTDQANIQKLLEEADHIAIDSFDASTLKTRLTSLEKKLNKNQLLRSKYANQPTKFLESEVALDDEIARLKDILSEPLLFHDFLSLNGIPIVLSLISHENTDISVDVLSLLCDLTDPESVFQKDVDENVGGLIVDHLLNNGAFELFVDNLLRFNESSEEESKGVYYTLQILENVSELRSQLNLLICQKTKILKFLVMRLRNPNFDENKLYSSEILSIYMQSGKELQELFGNKMDSLLESIAYYRRRNPQNHEEEELIENLFDSLCGSLFVKSNQDLFRSLEGFELMIKCMKEKKYAKDCALRVINHAVSGNERNCERLIEVGGLKHLFPSFMGRVSKKKKKMEDDEEHGVAIIAWLFLLSPRESKYQVCERLLFKFLENDMEKVDRLLELYEKYHKKQEMVVANFDEDDDERLEQRLSSGLFTFQRICLVMSYISLLSDNIKNKVNDKLCELNRTSTEICYILEEYANMMGEKDVDDPAAMDTKEKLLGLAQVFKDDKNRESDILEKEHFDKDERDTKEENS